MLQLARDVQCLAYAVGREDSRHDAVLLASKLVNIGYKVAIRSAMGGGPGQYCFQNQHHEFLIIAERHQNTIIDCHFKDQFKIGQHTLQYQQVLDCMPDLFVGSANCLVPSVELLCSEMAFAFKEWTVMCPPWRQPRTMISKWLATNAEDTLIGRSSTGINQATSCRSSSVSSDNKLGELLDSQVSPSGPMPSCRDGHGEHKQWEKVGSQLFVIFKGLKVKSLLLRRLAAVNSKRPGCAPEAPP